ncbi:MAG: CotH kinase family protein, partial [Clostridia bacterium]|nr:CotH kinase family protein [Clostridia bacterium]
MTLTYQVYFGDGKTISDNALKEMPADLIAPFSPTYNRQYYLVIPQHWNASNLRVFYTGVRSLTINGKEYKSGDKISLTLQKRVTVKPQKGSQIYITPLQTGGLPTLFIKTQSGNNKLIHADKTNKEPGYLYMLNAQGNVEYDGELTAVRGRGNATFKYDKKPYQIKLKDGASLAGMKKDRTYILLANALDRSQIRNTIALSLARYSGAFAFTPQLQSVDLYMNHDYKGTYLLTEKVEIDKSRIPITNLEDAIEKLNPELNFATLKAKGDAEVKNGARKYYAIPSVPKDVTGGYLLQSNVETRYPTEASGFVTKQGFPFTMQEPKYVTKKQVNYVADLFQQIENALFSKNGVDPASKKHYAQLLDMNSFVNRYLLAEVVDDYDGQRSYFYKDSDSVNPTVYVGPVWDQDNILGAYSRQNNAAEIHIANDKSKPYYWFTQATKHGDFRYAAITAYQDIYAPALNILLGKAKDPAGVLKSIDQYAAEVKRSATMDLIRWPNSLRNTYNYINRNTGSNFEEQVKYLKNYLQKRKAALDKAFAVSGRKGLTPGPAARTPAPTAQPTAAPTAAPVKIAVAVSTRQPTEAPTPVPTAVP